MSFFCQQCGAPLARSAYSGLERHDCNFEQLLEFQLQCAQIEIENGLEAQVEVWERDPRLAKRLAFARFVRDRHEAAVADPAARRAA
jgi:hypothetical protein